MGGSARSSRKSDTARQNGRQGGRPHATLRSYIEGRFWPTYAPTVQASTRATASYVIAVIKADLGELSFNALTDDRIETWWATVRGRGHGPDHTNRHLSYLRLILKKALKHGLLVADPTRECKKLRTKTRVRSLTDEQRERVFKTANDDLRLYCYAAYYIPVCRRQDIAALRRRDFDLAPRPDAPHGVVRFEIEKTDEPHVQPLHPRFRAVIEPVLLGLKPDDFVFPQYTDLHSITQAFSRLAKKLDLGDFHFHDLRHDAGTKALEVTGDLGTVQKLLGHKQISTTQKYAHYVGLRAIGRAVEGL